MTSTQRGCWLRLVGRRMSTKCMFRRRGLLKTGRRSGIRRRRSWEGLYRLWCSRRMLRGGLRGALSILTKRSEKRRAFSQRLDGCRPPTPSPSVSTSAKSFFPGTSTACCSTKRRTSRTAINCIRKPVSFSACRTTLQPWTLFHFYSAIVNKWFLILLIYYIQIYYI